VTVPRDDWEARSSLERDAREGLELAGPMSMAETYYLARGAEGMGEMEARFATRMRDRLAPEAGAGPRVAAESHLDPLQMG